MSTTITKKFASAHRLVYELSGDGTATDVDISNATLLADAVAGPLKDLLSASYANQAAARNAFLYGNPARLRFHLQTRVNDVTAQKNQPSADVDVSTNAVIIHTQMSNTTGQVAILTIEYLHTLVR